MGAADPAGGVASAPVATESLQGKVAAITGASSGIGEATALALSRAGAAVGVGARRADRLEALVKRIQGEGGRAGLRP